MYGHEWCRDAMSIVMLVQQCNCELIVIQIWFQLKGNCFLLPFFQMFMSCTWWWMIVWSSQLNYNNNCFLFISTFKFYVWYGECLCHGTWMNHVYYNFSSWSLLFILVERKQFIHVYGYRHDEMSWKEYVEWNASKVTWFPFVYLSYFTFSFSFFNFNLRIWWGMDCM